MKTHYQVLGVSRTADAGTIKAAYRKALKAYHPDMRMGDATAEHYSKRIIAAYDVLKDPEQRSRYDSHLHQARKQRRRLFLITLLTSMGVVTSGSLLLLTHWLNPGAPDVARRIELPPAQADTAWPHLVYADIGSDADPVWSAPAFAYAPAPTMLAPSWKSGTPPLAEEILAHAPATSGQASVADASDGAAATADIVTAALLAESVAAAAVPADDGVAKPALAGDLPSASPPPTETAVAEFREGETAAGIAENAGAVATEAAAPMSEEIGADGYLRRASLLVSSGEIESALDAYSAAIRMDDSRIDAFHSRGLLWWRLGDLNRALADLDRAIRLSFSDPKIYNDRGRIWLAKGSLDRAIADFSQAIKLNPGHAEAYLHRGVTLQRKGDRERSLADLEQALQLNPELAEARNGGSERPAAGPGTATGQAAGSH